MRTSILLFISAFAFIENVNAQELGAPLSYEDCLATARSPQQAADVCEELQEKLQKCAANESSSPLDIKDCHYRVNQWYNSAMNPGAKKPQNNDSVEMLPSHSSYENRDRDGKGFSSHDLGVQ